MGIFWVRMHFDGVIARSDQSGKSFRAVDFGETRSFERVNFRGSDLSGASFSRGYLDDGEVHTKHHLDQVCSPSVLRECDFTSANLTETNFYGCDLRAVNLTKATAKRADFRRALLVNAHGEDVDLTGALLSGANLDSTDFYYSSFAGAVLGATAFGMSSKYEGQALLTPASFRFALLIGVDFTNADLRGVDFTGADLNAARLEGALLDGAILPQ